MLERFICYLTHSKSLKLPREIAENDPNDQLRQWAEEQLHRIENEEGRKWI